MCWEVITGKTKQNKTKEIKDKRGFLDGTYSVWVSENTNPLKLDNRRKCLAIWTMELCDDCSTGGDEMK